MSAPAKTHGLCNASQSNDWQVLPTPITADIKLNVSTTFSRGDTLGLGISARAIGQGRIAARAMDAYLQKEGYKRPHMGAPVKHTGMRLDYYEPAPRNEEMEISAEEAIAGFQEIKNAISTEQAPAEAGRCMSCGLCNVCDPCRIYCPQQAISRSFKRPKGQVIPTTPVVQVIMCVSRPVPRGTFRWVWASSVPLRYKGHFLFW